MIKYVWNTSKVVLEGWCCQATKHSNSSVLATRWSPWQSSYSPPLRTYQHNTKNTSVLNGYLLKSWQLGGGGKGRGEVQTFHAPLLHLIWWQNDSMWLSLVIFWLPFQKTCIFGSISNKNLSRKASGKNLHYSW